MIKTLKFRKRKLDVHYDRWVEDYIWRTMTDQYYIAVAFNVAQKHNMFLVSSKIRGAEATLRSKLVFHCEKEEDWRVFVQEFVMTAGQYFTEGKW